MREIQGYTREGFAEKADLAPQFLYEVEVGRKGLSADTLARVAKALVCSSDYLLFGEKQRKSEHVRYLLETMEQERLDMIYDLLVAIKQICDNYIKNLK